MRILIVGAGRIGRGLLGELFARAGWSVVFVERSESLAGELRQRGSYAVHLAGEEGLVERTVVSDFSVLAADSRDAVAEEVGRADLLAVAVQPSDLAGAAELLAAGLRRRFSGRTTGLNLILCANASGAASELRRALERAVALDGSSQSAFALASAASANRF